MTRLALVPRRERSPGSSRYELLVKIASGATATVYVARLNAAPGSGSEATTSLSFSRLVAVKRAHPHLVDDAAARQTLLGEARLASRIHHANVVAVQDVDETDDDLLLVMEYVEGGSLAELLEASGARNEPVPPPVGVKIALDACAGLAAVHELCDDDGRPLGLVHRDISPQNVLVGVDGTARITDFGLARLAPSANASRTTGAVQGKIAYVSPEYVEGATFDVKSEVFALGVVVWEALTNRRLFRGANEADTLRRVLSAPAPPISQVAPHLGALLDPIIARALEKQPARRYESVRAFAEAIERVARKQDLIGSSSEVGAWVRRLLGASLEQRRTMLRQSVAPGGGVDQSFSDTVSMLHTDVLSQLAPVAEPPRSAPPESARVVPPPPVSDRASRPPVSDRALPPAPLPDPLDEQDISDHSAVAELLPVMPVAHNDRHSFTPVSVLPPPPRPSYPSRPSQPSLPSVVAPPVVAAPRAVAAPEPIEEEMQTTRTLPAIPSRTPIVITAAALGACVLMLSISISMSPPEPAPPVRVVPLESAAPPETPLPASASASASAAATTPPLPFPIPEIKATALPEAPADKPVRKAAAPSRPPPAAPQPAPPPAPADEPASPSKPPPNPYKQKK